MASATVKLLQDIANQIREENIKGKERIPTSETLIKKLMSQHSKTSEEILFYLEQLKEFHFIFIINLVAEDPVLYVQKVDGYVYAELSILNELKHLSEQKLSTAYENQLYKRKSGFQISKELFPKVKEYNNTPLGRSLNEFVMIEDFIRQITSNSFEYNDAWRKEKLYKSYKEEEGSYYSDESSDEEISTPSQTVEKQRYIDPGNSKWAKAVNQFSVQFLIRIHFRKYEFDVVKKLINTSKISLLEDLVYIRNTLKELETELDKDPILKYHIDKIIELRRIAQGKINAIRKVQAGN